MLVKTPYQSTPAVTPQHLRHFLSPIHLDTGVTTPTMALLCLPVHHRPRSQHGQQNTPAASFAFFFPRIPHPQNVRLIETQRRDLPLEGACHLAAVNSSEGFVTITRHGGAQKLISLSQFKQYAEKSSP
jgi:hypothetical protein